MRATMGIGPNKLPVQWASSAVFAVVNTQRRSQARGAAGNYLAWERVVMMDAVRADEDLVEQARQQKTDARRYLDTTVRRAFQHVLYLSQGDEADHSRIDRIITFEQENQSGLDGTVVWTALVEKQKAFAVGAFDAKALLHNLIDGDYDRPLDEVRDLFWSSPRMPLLPGGDGDLQRAIFQALEEGTIRLVGSDGLDRVVNRAGDIGVGQSGLRLLKPLDSEVDVGGEEVEEEKEEEHEEEANEEEDQQELSFSLMTTITDDDKREAVRLLLRSLSYAVDEGKVSYAQLMVRINANSSVTEEIAEEARAAGTSPMVK